MRPGANPPGSAGVWEREGPGRLAENPIGGGDVHWFEERGTRRRATNRTPLARVVTQQPVPGVTIRTG